MPCNASYTRFILEEPFEDRKCLGTHLNTNKNQFSLK
jgi:hypothetical protein